MKRRGFILALLFGFFSFILLSIVQTAVSVLETNAQDGWVTVGYDLQNTNFNRTENSLKPPLKQVWMSSFPSDRFPENVILWQDILLVAEGGQSGVPNQLKAFNANTGKQLWSFVLPDSGGAMDNIPSVADGIVYFGGQDHKPGYLYAVDIHTGTLRWQFPVQGGLYSRNTKVYKGKVYAHGLWEFYAVDKDTGKLIWSIHRDNEAGQVTPAIADNTIFLGSSSGTTLSAIDADTGRIKWSVDNASTVFNVPAVDENQRIVFSLAGSRTVKAFSFKGKLVWQRDFNEEITASAGGAFAIANGILYVAIGNDGSGNAKVRALDAKSGKDVWQFTLQGEGVHTPTVANGIVYVIGHSNGRLVALDAQTGSRLWEFSGNHGNGQAIIANGALYVMMASWGGNLYKFESESLPPQTDDLIIPDLASAVPGPVAQEFNFKLDARKEASQAFTFSVDTPGEISIFVQWSGEAISGDYVSPSLTAILSGPRGIEYYRTEGRSDLSFLSLRQDVTQKMLQQGTQWQISIVNSTGDASATGIVGIIFKKIPELADAPFTMNDWKVNGEAYAAGTTATGFTFSVRYFGDGQPDYVKVNITSVKDDSYETTSYPTKASTSDINCKDGCTYESSPITLSAGLYLYSFSAVAGGYEVSVNPKPGHCCPVITLEMMREAIRAYIKESPPYPPIGDTDEEAREFLKRWIFYYFGKKRTPGCSKIDNCPPMDVCSEEYDCNRMNQDLFKLYYESCERGLELYYLLKGKSCKGVTKAKAVIVTQPECKTVSVTPAKPAEHCGTISLNPRIISFSGHKWQVKEGYEGPGPKIRNHWSASNNNVCVDEQGRLHLKVTFDEVEGKWYSSEIWLVDDNLKPKPLGYGDYIFYLDTPPEQVSKTYARNGLLNDRGLVLGLFTYFEQPDDGNDKIEVDKGEGEIDIEFTNAWWMGNGHNAQYAVKPGEENRHTLSIIASGKSTHMFTYNDRKEKTIVFRSFTGHTSDPQQQTNWTWSYTGDNAPEPNSLRPRINLWLFDAIPPPDADTREKVLKYEVIINRFEFRSKTKAETLATLLDNNNNNRIDDDEILVAIDYWIKGEVVPIAGGQVISDEEILALIDKWIKGNRDSDNDGIPNEHDQCPHQPGPWSNDGCPVPKSYLITNGIPYEPISRTGQSFFASNATVDFQSGTLVLSANADGTGDIMVDDVMDLQVTHADGTTSAHTIDFTFSCSQYVAPLPPQDITFLFKRGTNNIRLVFHDQCGGNGGSTRIYLVNK